MMQGMSGGGMGAAAKGINQAIGAGVSAIRGHRYGSDLARRFGPIERDASVAANLQTVLQQQDFNQNLQLRKDLLSDIAELRAPESIQERAAGLKGFTQAARGATATARASKTTGAILDAARMIRRESRNKRMRNMDEARRLAELDVGERVEQAGEQATELERQRRKRQMMFEFFSRHIENRRYVEGAKAKKRDALMATATGFLAPS